MYFRTKRSGGFEYLQMVESHRVNGKPRQTVVATLGRLDTLKETGEFDRLLRSGARLTESGMLLSAVERGETTTIDAKRIGPPLLFLLVAGFRNVNGPSKMRSRHVDAATQ